MTEAPELLRSFLRHPGESARVDYKAAVLFDEKSDFALKLAKHCQGFANGGGGYIVIGFREGTDGHPQPDPNLSEQILKSYDVTRLSQHVNSFLVGQDVVDLTIYKEQHQEQKFPVISVRPFLDHPVFCSKTVHSSDGEEIMRQGAIYIRNREARTTVIAGPAEWRVLIDNCVVAKRDEFVRTLKVTLESYVKLDLPGGEKAQDQWVKEVRASVFKRLRQEA